MASSTTISFTHCSSCSARDIFFWFHIITITTLLMARTTRAGPSNFTTAILIRVDQSGAGDFKKIQDAIDSVPSNNTDQLYFIWVKPGTYSEKLVVPSDKPYITLSGTNPATTIVTWQDGGDIYTSPTLTVLASDFVARLITIQNTFGNTGKAVALRVAGDKAAFYGCRFISYQDTLLDDRGGHYFSNCYIEGATDFIFGNGASLYEKCRIHSVAEGMGIITAQGRASPLDKTGFVFLGCKITALNGTSLVLGRPWGPYARVLFALTYMSSAVVPQGWDDWGDQTRQSTVFFAQHKCWGPGASTSARVGWSQSALTDDEAAPYLTKDIIGGRDWLRPLPTQFRKAGSTTLIRSLF
ncbi:hypothetical protein MKW92_007293 [Papaver armeniacum]|nr:hypothetical protein MKW92_007293 [Papaver armeniacum]